MIAEELGIQVDKDVLEPPADRSQGDLRSTINDLEAMAREWIRVTMGNLGPC
jgi:DNA polymerase III delta prime subunit